MPKKSYYGIYQGVVTNIQDNEKRGRIKVKCPSVLGGNTESAWCDPLVPVAYDNGGDFCLPSKNEAVWLMFIEGDSNKPVWLGGWWQKDKTPLGSGYSNIDKLRIINYADCTISMKNGVIDINIGEGDYDLKIENGQISIKGNLSVSGNVNVTGNVTANSVMGSSSGGVMTVDSITANSITASSVSASGVSLSNHTHGGVMRGNDDTDKPN